MALRQNWHRPKVTCLNRLKSENLNVLNHKAHLVLPCVKLHFIWTIRLTATVNSEVFARVLFRETSHMRSFVKIKSSHIGEIILSFTDIDTSCHSREFLTSQICL